jgi:hypothetical protein
LAAHRSPKYGHERSVQMFCKTFVPKQLTNQNPTITTKEDILHPTQKPLKGSRELSFVCPCDVDVMRVAMATGYSQLNMSQNKSD